MLGVLAFLALRPGRGWLRRSRRASPHVEDGKRRGDSSTEKLTPAQSPIVDSVLGSASTATSQDAFPPVPAGKQRLPLSYASSGLSLLHFHSRRCGVGPLQHMRAACGSPARLHSCYRCLPACLIILSPPLPETPCSPYSLNDDPLLTFIRTSLADSLPANPSGGPSGSAHGSSDLPADVAEWCGLRLGGTALLGAQGRVWALPGAVYPPSCALRLDTPCVALRPTNAVQGDRVERHRGAGGSRQGLLCEWERAGQAGAAGAARLRSVAGVGFGARCPPACPAHRL